MSLAFCLAVAVIAAVIRMAVGMIASCIGALDGVIIRGMDALMAIPGVLLAIAVASLSGATLAAVIVALVIAEIPRTL